MKNGEYVKSEHKEIIFYVAIGLISILLPLSFGFILGGFEESFVTGEPLRFGDYLTNFLIYVFFFIISLGYIIFPISSLIAISPDKDAITQKNPSWFRIFCVTYIYAPEKYGLLWYLSERMGFSGKRNFMRWSINPLRVIVLSIIVFGIYGLFLIVNPQSAISSTPLAQQVTLASDLAFGSGIPSFSENGTLLFVFSLFCGISAYLSAKFFNGNKWTYFGISFIGCFLMAFFWMGLHSIVYGNSDASLMATFIFGFLGSFITLLFGIFLPWFIWHFTNNAVITLADYVSAKEDLILIFGLFLFVLLVLWIGIELLLRKRRKKIQQVSFPSN